MLFTLVDLKSMSRIHDNRPRQQGQSQVIENKVENQRGRRNSRDAFMNQQAHSTHVETELPPPVGIKSFLWCALDRLDGCCTPVCGRTRDVTNSPSVKQRHFSSGLEPLQVTTAEEDVHQFAFSGSFPNDGTFPVPEEELLDACYHELDEESEVSVAMARNFQSPKTLGRQRSGGRGVIRKYYEQCSGETDMSSSTSYSKTHQQMGNRYGPQQISCHTMTAPTAQVAGLASGRG